MSTACHLIKLFTAIYLLFHGAVQLSWAQNLAPNPSFEEYFACPTGIHDPITPNFNCIPWHPGTAGTADYFNACANPNAIGVPDNDFGSQPALSGDAYTGFWSIIHWDSEYREYVQTYLESPMIGGKWYYVSFYVSLSEGEKVNNFSDCGIEKIGAYFSVEDPDYNGWNAMPFTPQVESSGVFYSDTTNWMLVEGCFQATGDENVITIGNFHNDDDTNFDTACINYPYEAYYYLDDVYVGEVISGLDLELDGPVSACDIYTIDPGINGVEYYWEDGSSASTFTVTTSGTYSLTIYDGCNAGVDSIEVEIINAPDDLIAEEEITVCQGETVEISLDPDLVEYTWGDGSHATEYVITTTGVYMVTLDDGCDIITDQIDVTVLDPPSPFSLGGDTVLCTGSDLEINFDPDLGDFLWQNNSTSNFFIITQSGTYAVTISNMCGEASAELNVTETMPAYVSLGPNHDTLCTGEVLEIALDSTIGTYVWQDGSMGTNYQISSGGLFTVTMTHYCGQSSDSITVLTLATPSFDLGDTINSCPGESWTIAITNWIGEYTWQDGSDTNFIVVTTSGTYSLTIENACGTDSGDIVMIYEDSLVSLSLGPDFSLCPGEEATLFANTPGATYTWQNLSTADSFLVNGAGTYYVMVSNSCQSLSDTVIVTIENMPPSISLPDELTLCQGNSELLDPGVSGVTYDWNDGTHNPTLIISAAGQYTLTVTNACGSDVDTVTVLDGGPVPVVSLGPDTSICSGVVFHLNPVSSNVNTWLWPDGSMSTNYNASSEGPVYVEVANECGVAFDTMIVSLLPLTPPLSLGPDLELCPGATINLMITEPNVDITWSDGSTGNNFMVTDADIQVFAMITNGCGQSADTISVTLLLPAPTLDLGADQSLCPGEVITFDPGITGVNYLWQDGSTTTSFQTTQQATIILTISNVCGSATDTIVVIESTDGPQVDLGPDVHACEGEMISISSGISGVSYLWQDGSTNDEYVATTSGWVHLTVTNLCGTDTDSILVDISGVVPSPDLGSDTTLCEGITLMLVSHADASTLIEWQDGSSSPNFLVTSAGSYTLMETNQCGMGIDSIVVAFIPLPLFELNLPSPVSLCPGTQITLDAEQTFAATYLWSTGENNASIVVSTPGVYSVDVSAPCSSITGQVEVISNNDCGEEGDDDIYIPNVFSPNDDQVNDVFTFSFGSDLQLKAIEGSIYDRWGNLVFYSETIPFVWDGRFNGETVMPGVYVYKVKLKYMSGGEEKVESVTGDVTVLR